MKDYKKYQNQYRAFKVECPFYKDSFGNAYTKAIHCEGIGDAKITALLFDSKADLDKQMDCFCCSPCHKYCEIYRMLMAYKYEEV